jgi:hypothetical protein
VLKNYNINIRNEITHKRNQRERLKHNKEELETGENRVCNFGIFWSQS